MADTLHALGGILLKAVPTFVLVVLLFLYLKHIFFRPLEKVLRQRYEATEGARLLAEQTMARSAQRIAEYEEAMRSARSEVYQAQERHLKELQESEAAQLAAARQSAEAALKAAREQLAQDVEAAKAGLARDSEQLANEIAENILRVRGTAA